MATPMPKSRNSMKSLIKRALRPSSQSYFLFGPRGVGKSTWVKGQYPEAMRIDLLSPDIARELLAHPEKLGKLVDARQSDIIIIDEVQKAPAVLTVVHQLIESNRNLQFILTGSNARKLKQAGADLLGGRALRCFMHPFTGFELKENFSYSRALRYGLIPLIWNSDDPETSLDAYIDLYLKEEIQQEGLVRRLDDFARFLEAISFSHGAVLCVTNIARECEVNRKTVENYIQILDDLLIGYQIPVFSKKAKRELIKSSKFYFFDTGVFNTLRPRGPLDKPEEIGGASLEGLVAQHLRAWIDYCFPDHMLCFWRTKAKLEVDFIIYGPRVFAAIEVKASRHVTHADTRALREFKKDYPQARLLMLYGGDDRYVEGDVLILPCETFLTELQEIMIS
ncbi:MAG: ATP-binding protein [Gammaproteobacteria bacterium]